MKQYYIFEIQMDDMEQFAHLVHWAFDEDATMARLKAESKYHEVLANAAISSCKQHSASLLGSDGRCLMYQCYQHKTPEPEPNEE